MCVWMAHTSIPTRFDKSCRHAALVCQLRGRILKSPSSPLLAHHCLWQHAMCTSEFHSFLHRLSAWCCMELHYCVGGSYMASPHLVSRVGVSVVSLSIVGIGLRLRLRKYSHGFVWFYKAFTQSSIASKDVCAVTTYYDTDCIWAQLRCVSWQAVDWWILAVVWNGTF